MKGNENGDGSELMNDSGIAGMSSHTSTDTHAASLHYLAEETKQLIAEKVGKHVVSSIDIRSC